MQSGIIPGRFFNPGAIFGLLAVAFVALWGIYGLWIKNADLRPVTQTAQAGGINSCMDRYAGSTDDKLPQINALWSTYYLCDAITSRKLLYEEQVIRNENFVFQRSENTIIMLMVVSITISGVILAGLQLFASYKLASAGKGVLDGGGEVSFSAHSMAVKSSVVGVIILAISFAFFLVFVLYVYTFTPVSDRSAPGASSAPQAAAPQGSDANKETRRDTGQLPNVGKALPSHQSAPAENP
jgi:hypothetical protein